MKTINTIKRAWSALAELIVEAAYSFFYMCMPTVTVVGSAAVIVAVIFGTAPLHPILCWSIRIVFFFVIGTCVGLWIEKHEE